MNLLFLDTETTSIKEPHLVQLAYIHSNGSRCSHLFKPPVPIEEGASQVTGIYDKDVENSPAFPGSDQFQFLKDNLSSSIFVAHNAKFDISVLHLYGLTVGKYICTMKIARMVFPDEPNHKLESLYTSLGLVVSDGEEVKAHDALGDVTMMKRLLKYLTLKKMEITGQSIQDTLDSFVAMTMDPLIKKMPFGKHKGTPIEKLPKDYVLWLKSQPDMDTDVLHTIHTLSL